LSLIRSEVRVDALRVLEHVDPPPALAAPVAEVGRQLAQPICAFNVATTEQDPAYEGAAAVSIQFSGWIVAVRATGYRDQQPRQTPRYVSL